MSESIVRKVQPFTIGTRLSVPSVNKCQEFSQSFLPSEPLDNCVLQHNLNSLYLHQTQVCSHGSCLVSPTAPVKQNHEHMAAEDHLNQNSASPPAISRSIKKITISGGKERSDNKTTVRQAKLSITGSSSVNKNNNNNIPGTSDSLLPRIVGVSCRNKPNSQFKVLLSKNSSDDFQPTQGQLNREKPLQIPAPESQGSNSQRKERHPHTQDEGMEAVKPQNDSFTQRNSLFNKEALQAEAWIKSKLQDLKDGCNIRPGPLQDWEEASQTLQRDLKDFENTLIQLNQMGEQLICKLNPTSDLVKKQLSQLTDQWQTLKQLAANQMCTLGRVKTLQDFNKKVDKLEAWIKEKEQDQSMESLLGDNVDKMQLTRKILDLKQDEQLHRNLHEEINNLALNLEKQGKTDGRNISSRRKHINKMWLRVQSQLKHLHETLQQAFEVSSFYQQADNTLDSINKMRKNVFASKELDSFGDREIRDIASQIMMLDVSVSQLPDLHPDLAAGVRQKQTEIKDCWAFLQKTLSRSDRTTLSLSGSTFTREHVDPLTPAQEPQCNMGSETHGIMGKEVKEEQNRLKGYMRIVECESGQRTQSSPNQEQQDQNHTYTPEGDGSFCSNDDIIRHQPKAESRKSRTEPKISPAPRGHQQLHTQLQKFTVSADKTLSWLKDNVSMATQVCSIASSEGLEAAKTCQHTLEQEILNNRARIEVVKREGHGLVRAQHPGSMKIEEFLSQLEVLWEELRKRHQRNAAFLQASEKLGFRIVKVLQALGSLEAWLESVELSMKESALAGDPETMSMAERESCLLEKEVAARSLELGALRQEVDRLHAHSHPHTRGLPARMEEVERKYNCVLSALNQQSSELQDTRMLTEFLKRVELEESQDYSGGLYSLSQPLHCETTSAPTLFELQSSFGCETLIEAIRDPVEELREAVEMLNNTVRERGRSQSHDQAIQELLTKHAWLSVRVEESLCSSKELSLDILEKETDMAVQCEPDRCGLEALQHKQDQHEADSEVMRDEVKEMENQAFWLKELCPEKLHIFGAKIHATLEAWNELEKSVTQNKSRLREFVQLQDFFRSYLAMISWTEDTRSRIFSDTALQFGRDGQRPMVAELDMQIEQKFKEFDELAVTGKTLLDKEHHLTQMVRERMEELRSMLGWISVHWKAQKQQWLWKRTREMSSQDNIYSEATMCSPFKETSSPEPETSTTSKPQVIGICEDTIKTPRGSYSSTLMPGHNKHHDEKPLEDGYEIMNSIGPLGDPPKTNRTTLKESSNPPAGGPVNLILSFGNTGESQVQVLDLPAWMDETTETDEPVHRPTVPQSSACKNFWRRCQGLLENTLGSLKRKKKIYRKSATEVSTYLHVKDNNLAVAPVYESITLPRPKSRSADSTSPTFLHSSSPQSFSLPEPQITNVTFDPLIRSNSSSIFSSLKRMSKKRKRRKDMRRHTIQKIMGVDEQPAGMTQQYNCKSVPYDTHTWPLKESRRKESSQKDRDGAESLVYMKNPLLKDIDTECSGEYSITPYAVSAGPSGGQVKSHCKFLSLGSVLSFDLPKDMTFIPSIQDIITIAPPESKKHGETNPDPHSQRNTVLSSFRQTHFTPTITESSAEISSSGPVTNDKSFQPPPAPFSEDLNVKSGEETKNQSSQDRDAERERDELVLDIKSSTIRRNGMRMNECQTSSCTSVPHKHECLSVHTRIRDLKGHQYYKCAESQCEHKLEPKLNQASHMRVNLKSAMNVSIRRDFMDITTTNSLKVCTDAADNPKGVTGRLVCLEVGGIGCSETKEKDALSLRTSSDPTDVDTDPVHLDHQQFEEEEEELEDIWNQNTNYRQSICSDIMYQSNQGDLMVSDQVIKPLCCLPTTTSQDVLYRNLVTASAPNLLVAEVKLPSHIQSFLGQGKGQSGKHHLPPLAARDRRSWAAFPNREPSSKTSVIENETVSDPVKLQYIGDNPRYVYQYREEQEEEEVEEAKAGEELEEQAGCSKNQSVSLLSVHMGLGEDCQQSQEDVEKPQAQKATGGRCFILSGKPELQSMEGILERKQMLQLGGKKAASRGWNSYHTILHRHTLCFFQDRKDTLRSSACGLPLNLMGAECSPAPDYTKKPNCFQLRLRDGSEYLFNTSSRFMMKKWIMKIQACTGQTDLVSATSSLHVDQDPPTSLCGDQTTCHCSSKHDVVNTFLSHKSSSTSQTKEIVILTGEQSWTHRNHSECLNEQSNVSDVDFLDDEKCSLTQTMTHGPSGDSSSSPHSSESSIQEWLSSKQRSHSFTSATYQKLKPMLQSPEGRGVEQGSNYCVTLVVGDSLTDNRSTTSRDLEPSRSEWQQDTHQYSALGNCTSLPRTRNKSVLKKFFGKKDF